jgi:hypothetical protein
VRRYYLYIFLLLPFLCNAVDGLSRSYFYFAVSPIWQNFLSVDTTNLKSDPEIVRKSSFKIDGIHGYGINLVSKFYIRDYLAPYISFLSFSLQKGIGCINTVDIKNNRVINTVENFDIFPSKKGNALTLANDAILFKKKLCEKDFELVLHVGYNLLKSTFIAVWPQDSSISNVKLQGFIGGPKLYYHPDNKTTLLFYDYIVADRYSVVSSRNSLLGIDSGSAEFIYLTNLVNFSIYRNVYKRFDLGLSLAWAYATKVGKAKIDILHESEEDFINPRIAIFRGNTIECSFSLVWSF